MAGHPCAKGLTKDCFEAYPSWARQALAYKLLHILLPKQATKLLPRGLSLPLIAPGVPIPPGIEIPPEVVIPPDVVIPPGWTPVDPPPAGVIMPPVISPTPPDTGPSSPIYTPPFTPGPVHPPSPSPSPAFDIGSLLYEQGATETTIDFGDITARFKLGSRETWGAEARIHAVKLKIGKVGTPTDNVYLELRQHIPELQTAPLITGGTSATKSGNSLPSSPVGSEYLQFNFLLKPLITAGIRLMVVLCRSGSPDPSNYYQAGKTTVNGYLCWYNNGGESWTGSFYETLDYKIYGVLT